MLYPLKFNREFIEKSYGSDYLIKDFLHGQKTEIAIGDAILLGEYGDYRSRVGNGFLESNTLSELLEVYMGEVVGEPVYNVFGEFFPIAVKLVDANKDTPIYIHPTSEVAYQRHEAFGKDIFLYVLDVNDDSKLYIGLKNNFSDIDFEQSETKDILNVVNVSKGDSFYIPAGMPYSIGSGIRVLEVHQNSDIDYILSGSDNVDEIDQYEYPTEYASEAINREFKGFSKINNSKTEDISFSNGLYSVTSKSIVKESPYNIELKGSFISLFAVDGNFKIHCKGESYNLNASELIFIPAQISSVDVIGEGRVLEITIAEDVAGELEED